MNYIMHTGYLFGHKVTWCEETESWLDDTGKEPETDLACPKCHKKQTKEGHDPCIANLPGVKFACCGHGVDDGYIWFEDGTYIVGKITASYMKPSWSDDVDI